LYGSINYRISLKRNASRGSHQLNERGYVTASLARRGRLATITVVAEQHFAKEAKQRQRLSKGRGKKGSPIMADVNRNGEARE
jgi:hypothetical protein